MGMNAFNKIYVFQEMQKLRHKNVLEYDSTGRPNLTFLKII